MLELSRHVINALDELTKSARRGEIKTMEEYNITIQNSNKRMSEQKTEGKK